MLEVSHTITLVDDENIGGLGIYPVVPAEPGIYHVRLELNHTLPPPVGGGSGQFVTGYLVRNGEFHANASPGDSDGVPHPILTPNAGFWDCPVPSQPKAVASFIVDNTTGQGFSLLFTRVALDTGPVTATFNYTFQVSKLDN